MACFEGEGEVLVDGNWKILRSGQACLQPPFALNSLRCIEGKCWNFCWVRYLESREVVPIVTEKSPVLGAFDHAALKAAVRGLHAEVSGSNSPSALANWIGLIHHYVIEFAQPHHFDGRLWKLWSKVEKQLQRKWTLYELALISHMSEEHLRRLCRRFHGRSPMQHVTYLRMRRALELLESTNDKVETIAHCVGYETIYSFSNVFKKWIGKRPSECR